MIIHANISTLFIIHIICTYNKTTSHQLQETGVVVVTKHNVQVVVVFQEYGYVTEIEIVLVDGMRNIALLPQVNFCRTVKW